MRISPLSTKPTRTIPLGASILLRNKKGQLAEISQDVLAIIFFLFVSLLMYTIFALSGTARVSVSSLTAADTGADPFLGATLSAYLRTPLPGDLDTNPTINDPAVKTFLASNPEIWKGQTYGQFLSLLLTTQEQNPARIEDAFKTVTRSAFDKTPPADKAITLAYNLDTTPSSAQVITGDVPIVLPEPTAKSPIASLSKSRAMLILFAPVKRSETTP